MADVIRCAYCNDIVGAYEPIRLLLSDGSERPGSLLILTVQPDDTVIHERCHPEFIDELTAAQQN